MMRLDRWFLAPLLALVLLSAPVPAQTNAALAETLFQEGKKQMAAGNFAEACPKFQESQRLDPGTGTLLNWGLCLKDSGKPATAWVVFNQAVAAARAENRADRVSLAQSEIDKLETTMPRLAVVVPTDADAPGLVVTLDGSTISAATRGVATPVDPGEHVVTASAPQRKTWTTTVNVPAAAQTQQVVIPVLELGSSDAPPPPTPSRGITIDPAPSNVDAAAKPKRFVLGMRVNASIPAGNLARDVPLADYSRTQGTVWLEAGYRLRPELMLGGYLSVGSGAVGSTWDDALCDTDGVDCSMVDVRLGLQGTYHFGSKGVLPWVGAGFGFELMSVTATHDEFQEEFTHDVSGAEWLLLQGGVDFAVKNLQFGPFIALTFSRFGSGSCSGDCGVYGGEFDVANPAFHEWIMLGIRGTVGL